MNTGQPALPPCWPTWCSRSSRPCSCAASLAAGAELFATRVRYGGLLHRLQLLGGDLRRDRALHRDVPRSPAQATPSRPPTTSYFAAVAHPVTVLTMRETARAPARRTDRDGCRCAARASGHAPRGGRGRHLHRPRRPLGGNPDHRQGPLDPTGPVRGRDERHRDLRGRGRRRASPSPTG